MHDIPILMLHTVNDRPKLNPLGVLSVSQKGLDAYLKVFKKWKYQMISMDDLVKKNYDEAKPFVVLTFDDGYKDNLTVALPVLKKYNARATIFVNPAYISVSSDFESDWGFMTEEEIIEADRTGVFDIQAHTMTHEFIFTSDTIVDYYTPEKFNKYYWLAWMLFPDSPKAWDSNAMAYKEKIPVGYPVFEYNRRLSAKKFTPNKEYVDFLIENYNNGDTSLKEEFNGTHGEYETDEQFTEYAVWEVDECKKYIERLIGKDVHTLCFPGGGYTDEVLEIAQKSGYKCYMNASRLRVGNNNDHVIKLHNGEFVGLNRTSFSLIHLGVFPDNFYDYWVAKMSIANYQNKQPYAFMKKVLASLLRK
jgi:peptidoglycan/xylan/chitin deacetylase (PgdA/CDA1 family)